MNAKLKYLFEPRSVAVIGASRDSESVGYGILFNLLNGGFFQTKYNRPFKGKIFPVNPNAVEILGKLCYRSVKDIDERIELAVIAVSAKIVPKVMQECVEKGVRAAIVISAGFSELGEEGKSLQAEIARMARKYSMPLVGPNCLGIINPKFSLNASFAPAMPPEGDIAFISQSGALADSIIDWAVEKNYGFSKLISVGNAASLGVNDFMEYLESDKSTNAIAIYVESISDGRKFMEVAKACKKPIAIIKAGKTESGVKAASSHTGSLAGSYEIYNAAFRQAGVYEVNNVERLFEAAKTMAIQPRLSKNNIAIITNGGGAGVLAADYCAQNGLNLSRLSEETMQLLDNSEKMHIGWSRNNPIDLVGDALPARYELAINAALRQKDIHGLIVIQTLQTMTDPVENAKIIIRAREKFEKKPVIAVYMGGLFTKPGKLLLKSNGIPVFNDPEKAVLAMKALLYKKEVK